MATRPGAATIIDRCHTAILSTRTDVNDVPEPVPHKRSPRTRRPDPQLRLS
jgi:hypothetical protein